MTPHPRFPGTVCYVLEFLPTYVAREIRELTEQGVSILVHLPRGTPVSGLWDRVLEGCPDRWSRDLKLSWCGMPVLRFLLQAAPWLLRALALKPFKAGALARKAIRTGTFRYFAVAARLAAVPQVRKASLIHSHFAKDGAHIARYVSSLTGIPFTVTTHATDIFCPEDPGRVETLLREAAGVHTISCFNRDYMAERWGAELRDRVTVSRLGIDTGGLPPRTPSKGVPSIVCTASGLVPKKGLGILLDACGILASRGVGFVCSVVGSDPEGVLLRGYKGAVLRMGLEGKVLMEGLLTAEETLARVSSAMVFVLPSVEAPNGDMDGIPVSLMEAMGIGVPSVSTRLSGIPELIEDGVSGLLVEPGNPEALADAMAKLLDCNGLAERLGAAGRRKVLAEFSVSRYARELSEFWKRAVSDRVNREQ